MADWTPKTGVKLWTPKTGVPVKPKGNTWSSLGPILDDTWSNLKPILSRALTGPEPHQWSPDEIKEMQDPTPKWAEKLPLVGGYLNRRRLEASKDINPGDIQKIIGTPESEGSILPKFKQPESYAGGFANSLYNDFVRPLGTPSGILGATRPKPVPTLGPTNWVKGSPPGAPDAISSLRFPGQQSVVDTSRLSQAMEDLKNPNLVYGPKNAPLGLPPAPDMPRFYQGKAGIADSTKEYPIDTGQDPELFSGTLGPHEFGERVRIPPIQAAERGVGNLGDIPAPPVRTPTEALDFIKRAQKGPVRLPKEEKPFYPKETPTQFEQPSAKPTWRPKTGVEIDPTTNQPKVSEGVPKPGQAVAEVPKPKPSKDISAFRSEFGSVDKTLSSRPETTPIATAITQAADKKGQWLATTQRRLADLTKGLNRKQRIEVGDLLDKHENPAIAVPDNPLAQVAQALRKEFENIYSLIPEGARTKGGGDIGFIKNYLTHIEKQGSDDLASGMKQIWEYHFKKPFKNMFSGEEIGKESSGLGDILDKALGKPASKFIEKRTGKLENIQLDVNKVIPAYTESIAKQIFDRPAVDAARKVIETLPDTDIYGAPSRLKDLSKWYVRNYTRYDSLPGLTQAWHDLSSRISRTTARSMLGFSTGLQSLHLARIPVNLWPELPTKYLVSGVGQIVKNPVAAWKEAASLGLLQNEVRPMAFKTATQKLDSLLSMFSAADFIDRSIGYHGFKKMLMDQGANEADASLKAIGLSKKASLFVDAARPIKGFTSDAAVFGGMAGKLSTQFKQIPVKIIEQYLQIASNAKKDPKAAARAVTGLGLAIAAAEAGLRTIHVSPKQFAVDMFGASGTEMNKIGRFLAKGDVTNALKETALWVTPGGISMKRQLEKGPSMFESDVAPPPKFGKPRL